jgi:hypothetical protein
VGCGLLNDHNKLRCTCVCLVTTAAFHSDLREGSVITTAQRRNRPHGLWSRPCGKSGDKRGKDKAGTRMNKSRVHTRAQGLLSRFAYGSGGSCLPHLSNTRQSDSHEQTDTGSSAMTEARRTTTTSRQSSKLAEGSQEGEKGCKRNRKMKSGRQDPGAGK